MKTDDIPEEYKKGNVQIPIEKYFELLEMGEKAKKYKKTIDHVQRLLKSVNAVMPKRMAQIIEEYNLANDVTFIVRGDDVLINLDK